MFGKKRSKTGKLPQIGTVVGRGTNVSGDVSFEGGMHVDGKVSGNVSAPEGEHTLVLSEVGRVEGEVRVPTVVINGEVHGDVYAHHVELAAKASIHGTVYYHYLEMMMGSVVNGQLVKVDPNASSATAAKKRVKQSQPQAQPEAVVRRFQREGSTDEEAVPVTANRESRKK
jgi:cytoskeletal protein CcmA (bactofilin family)